MPKYITYMSVILHSQGASPSELIKIMKSHGWKPMFGGYDFIYEWDIDIKWTGGSFEFFCELNDIHEKLKNMNVSYTLKTFERGKTNPIAVRCP